MTDKRKMMTDDRRKQLEALMERLAVPCENLSLIDQATTHTSYAAEHDVSHFERLEFFGDAVLKFVVAEYMLETFPKMHEGELTEICAVLISAKTLEQIGREFQLENYIRVGRNVPMRPSIVARSMEAVLGAVYMDSKFDNVRRLIVDSICSRAAEVSQDAVKENYKAQLQQWTQARAQGTPVYSVIKVDGPPHAPIFQVGVLIENKMIAQGEGASKKIAEQAAARAAFDKLANS